MYSVANTILSPPNSAMPTLIEKFRNLPNIWCRPLGKTYVWGNFW